MDRLLDRLRAERHSDAGVTLVETLMALVILSIAAVAILAGLQMSVAASDIHRKQSTGGAYVRSYAEAIERHLDQTSNYVPCAGAGVYSAATVGFTVPSGYSATHQAAETLDGNGSVVACANDQGAQRLTLVVSSDDNRASERLTIVVRRACGEGSSCT